MTIGGVPGTPPYPLYTSISPGFTDLCSQAFLATAGQEHLPGKSQMAKKKGGPWGNFTIFSSKISQHAFHSMWFQLIVEFLRGYSRLEMGPVTSHVPFRLTLTNCAAAPLHNHFTGWLIGIPHCGLWYPSRNLYSTKSAEMSILGVCQIRNTLW